MEQEKIIENGYKAEDITNNPYYYRRIRCDLVTLKQQHIFDEKIIECINKVKDALGKYIKEEWGEELLYEDFDEETLTPISDDTITGD